MGDVLGAAEKTGRQASRGDFGGLAKYLFIVIVGSGLVLGAVWVGFRVISGRFMASVTNMGRGVMRLGQQTVEEGAEVVVGFEGAA